MPSLVQIAVLLLALLVPSEAFTATASNHHPACPGVPVALFESRVPQDARRYTFDRSTLGPFVRLWRSGDRPNLPIRPEKVTVYALPHHPFLVGYQNGGCLIGFLSVDREQLLRWLRPQIGWAA